MWCFSSPIPCYRPYVTHRGPQHIVICKLFWTNRALQHLRFIIGTTWTIRSFCFTKGTEGNQSVKHWTIPGSSHLQIKSSSEFFESSREGATDDLHGTQLSWGVAKLPSWLLKSPDKTFKESILHNVTLNVNAAAQQNHLEVTFYHILLQYKIT